MLEYTLPVGGYKISVGTTAVNLLDAIETAAGQAISFPFDLSIVEISPESGDVRLGLNDITPTTTVGQLIEDAQRVKVVGAPRGMKIISTLGTISVNVRVGWDRPHQTQ